MTQKPSLDHSAHFDKHEKNHLTQSTVYINEAISLVVMRSQRIVIGPKKSPHCQTWLERRCFWNENLQRKQNWISKSTNVEENAGKWRQLLWSQQSCELKSLEVALNTAGVEKNTLGKLAVTVNAGGHSIRVLNEKSVSKGGNLCPLWLKILKSLW